MIADESLVTLNGLKKYDQRKGTAVIEANELPANPLNKVYNVGDDVYSKGVKLSTHQQMLDEVDKVTVDGNTQDANRNIISKAVLDVDTLPSTIGDKVYREETSTTQITTFTFRYGMTRAEIEALGFVYDQEASSATAQIYRWPETADKIEISFKIGTGSYIYKLTANTLDYNTSTGNYRVFVPAEQGGPQYYITSLDINKDYNFTVKETTYGEVKVYAKDTELATKGYADDTFIPLTQKAAANGVATLDANGHVPVEQMPTQALIFKGYWDASTGSFPAAGTVSGDFYIVSVEGTVSGVLYRPGDWIIWDGSAWTLSRNTNAVASVNGQTGAVTLDGSNIQATYEGTTDTINTLLTQVGKVKKVNSQTPDANGNIQVDGSNINATYEGTTDTINNLLTQVGKVKKVNNQSPDANGNILLDGSNIQATYEGTTDTINNLLTQVGASDIFTGTQAEWDALSAAEKDEYSQANITDTSSTVFVPVDTVANGNMNPVTSNAVYDAFAAIGTKLSFNLGDWTVRAGNEDTKTIGTLPAGTWIVFIQSLGYRTNLYASVGGNRVTTSSRYEDTECNGVGFGVVKVTTATSITATVIASSHDYGINGDGHYHNVTAIRIA